MKVAILDDEKIYLDLIRQEVGRVFPNIECIRQYADSEGLLYDLAEGIRYDIYFLDVELPGVDGMTAAREIRKQDTDANIIFITAFAKYAAESYDVRAYQYILKSQISEKLPKVLRHIAEELQVSAVEYYVAETSTRYDRIALRDILYIYKEKKYAIFATQQGDFRQRLTVSKIWEQLEHKHFVWVDRG
ncbi:MAG: LytTR family DNA-binding domain-containing protein [Eubacterium sp.]|nr:LytTR family DNA-binding domain-containing protein [Eubacterium sp.]